MAKLNEFFGESEILNQVSGKTIKSIEYIEDKEGGASLSLTLSDSKGNEKYLMFTDGSWHYGIQSEQEKEIQGIFEILKENDHESEIALILATYTAYNLPGEVYIKEYDGWTAAEITEDLSIRLMDLSFRWFALETVVSVIGHEKANDIAVNIENYMSKYHKYLHPFETAKENAIKAFTGLSGSENIFSLVTRDRTEVHQEIHDSLLINPVYKSTYDEVIAIENSINVNEKKKFLEFSDLTTDLETEAKEESYSKGFADGVRLAMACCQNK